MARKKEIDIRIEKKSACNNLNIKSIKASGPLVSSGSISQPRIVSASFNEDTNILTLTRDDGTIINVLIPTGGTSSVIYDSAFDSGTLTVDDVGGIDSGTDVDDLEGLTFSELFDLIFFPPINPTASLSGSGNKKVEVGTTISPVLTGTFNQGSAGSVTSLSLERNSSQIATVNPYTDTNLTSATPATFTYQMTFNYAADILPSGSINTNNVSYDFIYPIFYGISNDNNIDASDIIAGTKVVSDDTTPTVTFGASSSQYSWIAVPASFPTFTSWFVTALNNGGIGAGNTFGSPSTISVTTSEWSNVNYELYITNFTTEFNEPVTFS